MARDFNELKESTRNELTELMLKDKYDSNNLQEIKINLDKDFSDFSNLSDRTQKELAELTLADYSPTNENRGNIKPEFDGIRVMKIQEFISAEDRKMKEFISQEEGIRNQNKKEFTDTELMKKNLGIQESEIEITVKKAEVFEALGEREKKIQDYITGTTDTNEQLRRALAIGGTESTKDKMLKVLQLNKNYNPF